MTADEALKRFGLPAKAGFRDVIRALLEQQIVIEAKQEVFEPEILRTLCVQLFSIGVAEDSLLIWKAKNCNFDAACGLDIQFLCGAGLQATKDFLSASTDSQAAKALDYVLGCEEAGDFEEWSPGKWIDYYRKYYRL